jgi:hypothetical protein
LGPRRYPAQRWNRAGVVVHPYFFRSPEASAKQWMRFNKTLS